MSLIVAGTSSRVNQSSSRILGQSLLENSSDPSQSFGQLQTGNGKRKLPASTGLKSRDSPAKALKTPNRMMSTQRTIRSRRIVATPRAPQGQHNGIEQPGFEGILKKQWKTYSLSPLHNFKTAQTSLIKYARSLDSAVCQESCSRINPLETGSTRSSFSVYPGLTFLHGDPDAIQIQMCDNQTGQGSSVVFNAFLVCLGLQDNPVLEHLRDKFTYYPVLLVAGNKTRTNIFLDWLERHFDCRTSALTFTDTDLRWMLVTGCSHISAVKPPPILLQYSVSGLCDSISTVDCKFEATFCKMLWQRLLGDSKHEINEDEVNSFVGFLEEHLERTMYIFFRKLNLSEVGSSSSYVSCLGKIKIFFRDALFPVLHLLCDVSRDRFNKMFQETP